MDYAAVKERILAAHQLINVTSTSREKFEAARKLLAGIRPEIDRKLEAVSKALSDVEKLEKGDIIQLSAENLPETSEEEKKRKKALLFLVKLWKDLHGEIDRVRQELEQGGQTPKQQISVLGKILAAAKGPLGIVTLIAIAVIYLQTAAVSVVIQNQDCNPIAPMAAMRIPIPGLRLPTEVIPPGGSGVATLPPLPLSVDGSTRGLVKLRVLLLTLDYRLEDDGINLIFDGEPLVGKDTNLNLARSKEHTLVADCR